MKENVSGCFFSEHSVENEKDCMPAIITAREFRDFVYLLAEYEFGLELFFVELVDHVN